MRKTVLITGVSGGIGKELADRFAKDGHNIVLVARSEGKILELAQEYQNKYGIQATVIAKDVAATGVPVEIFNELKEKEIVVDSSCQQCRLRSVWGFYGDGYGAGNKYD